MKQRLAVFLAAGVLLAIGVPAAQADDSISVRGVITGPTSLQLSGQGSPMLAFQILPGTTFDLTGITSSTGSCSLSPTNGGAGCHWSMAVNSFDALVTFSGQPPPTIMVVVAWADGKTGTSDATIRTNQPPPPAKPKVSGSLRGLAQRNPDMKLSISGPGTMSISIKLPRGLTFSCKPSTGQQGCKGLSAVGAALLNEIAKRTNLTINLKAPAPLVTLDVRNPLLCETSGLQTEVENGKVTNEKVEIDLHSSSGTTARHMLFKDIRKPVFPHVTPHGCVVITP